MVRTEMELYERERERGRRGRRISDALEMIPKVALSKFYHAFQGEHALHVPLSFLGSCDEGRSQNEILRYKCILCIG